MKQQLMQTARKIKSIIQPSARTLLLKQMPKNAVCAEIGVWKGAFSGQIIEQTTPSKFHLIDPWMFQSEYPDRMYGGKIAKEQQDMDDIYQNICDTYGALPYVEIHRETSETALTSFDDEYFDWVYIDGNHYYEFVLKDLELSYQKVKKGGYVAGDDYDWGGNIDYPVQKAVADFMKTFNIEPSSLRVIGNQFMIKKAS